MCWAAEASIFLKNPNEMYLPEARIVYDYLSSYLDILLHDYGLEWDEVEGDIFSLEMMFVDLTIDLTREEYESLYHAYMSALIRSLQDDFIDRRHIIYSQIIRILAMIRNRFGYELFGVKWWELR